MQKDSYIQMATNEELRAQVLSTKTCGICSRVCSDPRTLSCLHSFCLDCLKELIDSYQEIGAFCCPTCDYKTIPTPGCSVDTRFLEWLGANSIFSENRTSILEEHGMIQCKKHPDYVCDFFYSDTLDLACDMCKSQRNECCENLTKEAAYIIWKKRQEFLKQSYCSTRSELTDVLNILKSRENERLAKNDETILGIMKYFMDFKMQIQEYLERHEKDVLEKLKNFTATEITKIVTNSQKCFSLLQSIDSRFSFLTKPSTDSCETNALSNYLHVEILQSVADNYLETVKSEKHQAENQTEIRFIINTEIEDILTGGDLINVELITPSNTHSGALCNNSRQIIDSFTNGIQNGINIAPNFPSSAENSVSVLSPAIFFPDEPPPPYPGVIPKGPPTADLQTPNPLECRYKGEENYYHQTSETLGEHQILPSSRSLQDSYTTPHVPRALTHGVHQEPVTPLATPSDSNKLRIQPIIKFNVDSPNSTEGMPPILVNISWITEDALLVVDKINKAISLHSEQGTCLLVYNLQESCEPYGCVAYGFLGSRTKNFLALTIPKQNKIMIYYIHNVYQWQLKFKDNKRTNKGYTQITFAESEMKFICASTSPFSLPLVGVLDEQFNILYTLNGSDTVRLGYPRSVQVSKDGVIAVSDYKTSRVLFMTMRGIHKNVFNGTDERHLSDMQGIGYYDKLDLFVIADTRANRIYFVTSQGDLYECFGHDSLSEKTPRFIDFSTGSTPKVAIGHGNGFVFIYEVIDLTACPLESTV